MKNDIVEKLNRVINGLPLTDEANVVYLLTEVRKTFEHDNSLGQTFPTLEFYCNWALHVLLDRKSAQAFLNSVLPILTLNGSHTESEHKAFHSLLTLQAFRDELRQFFAHNGISEVLCENSDHWAKFLEAYSRVVQDSVLVLKGNTVPSGPLNVAVQSVTVRCVAGLELAGNRPFPMDWQIQYLDGRSGELSLSEHGLLGATITMSAPPPVQGV